MRRSSRASRAPGPEVLAGTTPLSSVPDLAAEMVAGIERYLERRTREVALERPRRWSRDLSSHEAYTGSIEPKRARLRHILGLRDERDPPRLELVATLGAEAPHGREALREETPRFRVWAVRFRVFRRVSGEGLLLEPRGEPAADVVALPDCDMAPEELEVARELAERGCRVVVPALIGRSDEHSGLPGVRHVHIPQREFLWRACYELGRTLVGYEIQKALAAVDWLRETGGGRPVGVLGYGEGGLEALCAAGVDERIAAAAVSGYVRSRDGLWEEPIERHAWSCLVDFADAELLSLVAPRAVVVEAGRYPEHVRPAPGAADDGMAPSALSRPPEAEVEAEVERARGLVRGLRPAPILELVKPGPDAVGSEETVVAFLGALGVPRRRHARSGTAGARAPERGRELRQYLEILEDTQELMRESENVRESFWSEQRPQLEHFRTEIIGSLPAGEALPPAPRSRRIFETELVTGYEVVLDVMRDVFAQGILCVPRSLAAGERRPVVVCQHGLEGTPWDVADPAVENEYYHRFAFRLAERGFVTFAPQNPYRGGERFRRLLRRSRPLGLTLYSFIVRQHECICDWLASLPFVDLKRIAFYGLSYGGKCAMRVPPLVDRYCLSICSADFNEWILKNLSVRHPHCYLYTAEYDMPEFDLANTFNYAEMSRLIFPRPFMVERGHRDGVAPDEWVAYEYSKVRRYYVEGGHGERTEIEFFDGPHSINGRGTFAFLHRQLRLPEPESDGA